MLDLARGLRASVLLYVGADAMVRRLVGKGRDDAVRKWRERDFISRHLWYFHPLPSSTSPSPNHPGVWVLLWLRLAKNGELRVSTTTPKVNDDML
jgi:hypothetical protein